VEVIEADAADVHLDSPVDLVVSVDTLMLVPSWEAFLVPARALAGGKHNALVATTILRNRLSAEQRALFWREDGMISLLSTQEAEAALSAAGFERPVLSDRTTDAIAFLARIDAAITANEGSGEIAPDALQKWRRMNDIYMHAFASTQLRYVQIRAFLSTRRAS
jgi:hypothetical protein